MTIPPFLFNHQAVAQALVSGAVLAGVGYWLIIGGAHVIALLRAQRDADRETARRERLDRIFAEKWRTR